MTFVAFPLLLAFWLFVCWRVRVERGVVLESAMERYVRAFRELNLALGRALTPVVRRAAAQISAWNDAWEAMLTAMPEVERAQLLAALNAPDGATLAYDTTPLLPEGGTE